jgi:hypothetical protein
MWYGGSSSSGMMMSAPDEGGNQWQLVAITNERDDDVRT